MDLALLATDTFETAVPDFVSQIADTDHLNLFLTALGYVFPLHLPYHPAR